MGGCCCSVAAREAVSKKKRRLVLPLKAPAAPAGAAAPSAADDPAAPLAERLAAAAGEVDAMGAAAAGDGRRVNLDLLWLDPQLVVMGFPAAGCEAVFRNPYPAVKALLDAAYPRAILGGDPAVPAPGGRRADGEAAQLSGHRTPACESLAAAGGNVSPTTGPHTPTSTALGGLLPAYRVFNLCAEPPHRYGEADKFGPGAVRWLPFWDHHACPLALIPRFVSEALDFLQGGDGLAAAGAAGTSSAGGRTAAAGRRRRGVVVHCKAGKGRTGLMACCLLMVLDPTRYPSAARAVERYGLLRTKDGRGLTHRSQIRYVGYWDRLMESTRAEGSADAAACVVPEAATRVGIQNAEARVPVYDAAWLGRVQTSLRAAPCLVLRRVELVGFGAAGILVGAVGIACGPSGRVALRRCASSDEHRRCLFEVVGWHSHHSVTDGVAELEAGAAASPDAGCWVVEGEGGDSWCAPPAGAPMAAAGRNASSGSGEEMATREPDSTICARPTAGLQVAGDFTVSLFKSAGVPRGSTKRIGGASLHTMFLGTGEGERSSFIPIKELDKLYKHPAVKGENAGTMGLKLEFD